MGLLRVSSVSPILSEQIIRLLQGILHISLSQFLEYSESALGL
jgi:hypothetical protein